ncbi:LIM domain protein, partial [Teladorsagia circumcincta]
GLQANGELPRKVLLPNGGENPNQIASDVNTLMPLAIIAGAARGVMARAAGHDLHGDCLSCATCGSSLRNVGHHFIEDRFYCDVHGRQKKGQGAPMDPALAVKTSPTSGNPERPVDGGRSFYQPEVMSRRPLSVSPTPQHTGTHIHYGTPKTHGTLSCKLERKRTPCEKRKDKVTTMNDERGNNKEIISTYCRSGSQTIS